MGTATHARTAASAAARAWNRSSSAEHPLPVAACALAFLSHTGDRTAGTVPSDASERRLGEFDRVTERPRSVAG